MSRRLTALRVGNFKAFAETQRIPLKPITLIFGPNSAGKSSFIHSLALAHEAQFGRDKRNLARLDIRHTDVGGSAIDLGGFRQYVHKGQLKRRVEWGADLSVAKLAGRISQLLASVETVTIAIALGMELDNQDRPKPGATPRVEAVEISGDGVELLRMSRRRTDGQGSTLRLDRLHSEHQVFRQILKAIVESATTSAEMRPEDFDSANVAIADLVRTLEVNVDRFLPNAVSLPRGEEIEPSSAGMLFPVSKGNRREDIASAVRFYLPRTLNDLVKGLSDVLNDEVMRLQYLGPLRSFPPRHLAFAEHEDANWYAGGGYAWDVVRNNEEVRNSVNEWLGADMLKTKYQLVVKAMIPELQVSSVIESELEDLLAELNPSPDKLEAPDGEGSEADVSESAFRERFGVPSSDDSDPEETSDSFESWRGLDATTVANWMMATISKDVEHVNELVLVDQSNRTQVSHRDVGIGISQVLPVLVLAFGSQNKLIAIEQPEIHLHPALQSELADVFIESALGGRQNTYILETHSEHLILRVMRRIREGVLSPSDVGIVFVKPDSNGSRFIDLRLDEDGDLIDDWPGGFFEEAFREKFAGR